MLTALSGLFRLMPLGLAMAVARAVGLFWYYAVPIRRAVAHANVRRALGPKLSAQRRRQIVRRCFQNICMYAVEELRMPDMTAKRSMQLVTREHIERIDALLAQGKGVIAVTAHIGNFELMGSSQTVRGYNIDAILKDIAWPSAQAFWTRARSRTRLGQIKPRGSKEHIVRALAQNHIVAMLVDQHMARHRSVVCRFFGQWASTSPAPVRFAEQTGAPILPLYITRTAKAGHHVIHFGEPFVLEHPYTLATDNLRHNTQRLNDILEGWIRAYPEQWLWMHKRWKVQDDPTGWDIPDTSPPLREQSL
jgi:KDO2-lipid IV(A) lauroyltransferase